MEQELLEADLREAVTLTAQLVRTLKRKLDKLPRGALLFANPAMPASLARCSTEVVSHMTRAIELLQPTGKQAGAQFSALPSLSNERGKPPQQYKLHAKISSDSSVSVVAAAAANLAEAAGRSSSSRMKLVSAATKAARRPPINFKLKVRVNGNSPEQADRFSWRKYGEKPINNAAYKRKDNNFLLKCKYALCRSYYRCMHKASHGCPAQKHVQKTEDVVTARAGYDITYINKHTCGIQKESLIISSCNDHANFLEYGNKSPEAFNSGSLDENSEYDANLFARIPCSFTTRSSTTSTSCNYLDALLHNNTTMISSSSSLLTSPSISCYANQMQTSCSNYNTAAKVLSDSPSSSQFRSAISAPRPFHYYTPQQNDTHTLISSNDFEITSLLTEQDHSLTGSSLSNFLFDYTNY